MDHKEQYDYLTGIYNRMGLFELFSSLKQNQNVLFFDIDNFKTVNDIYGHNKGDETLIRFAQVVKDIISDDSIVARLGGDEFVALIPGQVTREYISSVAQKILDTVRDMKTQDIAFEIISASIGIILNYKVEDGLDGALNLADKAMYFAKQQGKDTFVFYDDFENVINYESSVVRDAAKALEEDRFYVLYHPSVHMHSSRIICAEACCIMRTANGTTLGRNDIRTLLTQNGLIDEIDFYIFDKICKDVKKLKETIGLKHKIGVEFSLSLLLDERKQDRLLHIIKSNNVNESDFELNFVESIFDGRTSVDNIRNGMSKLKALGFSLALSRFGKDFSSVRYLKGLPISSLKLDGEFIKENIKDEEGNRILSSIIALGRGFKFSVIACKVDSNKDMYTLSECGCDAASGSFFADKMQFDDYVTYISRINKEDKDTITFRFEGNLRSDKGFIEGEYVGENMEYVPGINSEFGAVSMPGGDIKTSLIRFSTALFDNCSYTFSMWLKPAEHQEWVSALYIRYQRGFTSFMPTVAGGRCMFRIKADAKIDVWNDAMTNVLETDTWTFVACTYDEVTSVARLYINGQLESVVTDVPSLGLPKSVWLGGDVFQQSYHGMISGFTVNSIALEGEEIKERYLSEKV